MDPFSDDEGDSLLNNQLDEHALTEEEAVASKFCRLYDLVCAPTTKTGKMELSKIKLTSDVYLIKSRNPVWKSYTLELCGDILFITQHGKDPSPHKICWYYTETLEKEDSLNAQVGCKSTKRVWFITREGLMQMGHTSNDVMDDWISSLDKLMHQKYTEEELEEKAEAVMELLPLMREQEKVHAAHWKAIMNTLSESGFFIEPKLKKEKEGYLELGREGKEWKKVYVVLFPENIYLFKPHEKVSLNTQPYDWIELKNITSIRPSKKKDCFVIRTLLRRFTFHAKHDVAVGDWVNAVREVISKKTKVKTKRVKRSNDARGYIYTKSLDGRLSVSWLVAGKPKSKKLKGKETTIGRSSSSDIVLAEDKYISRAHCSISIEDNIPYLSDLGTTAGTKLNGEKIVKHPLAPGDQFVIGKTTFTFEVKDGHIIFSKSIGDSSDEEEDLVHLEESKVRK